MKFTYHTKDTAPSGSKALLDASLKAWQMIPNLHAVMAESPQLLQSYQELHQLFMQTSLTVEERSVVWLAISAANECHYCVPAHTAIAQMEGLDESIIEALRSGSPLPDSKLEELRKFTLALLKKNGKVSDEEQAAFLAAGFEPKQSLEIMVGIAQKILSNFVNHLAQTPLDDFAKKFAWKPSETSESEGAL